MSNPIIEVSELSKLYHIGNKLPYKTLRETLMNAVKSPATLFRRNGSGGDDTFWALKDVSFEVQQGEVIGIIGRNGAGKSTLLKILSRVTEPTEGEVRLRGRVASLLEVGTGFHPELTGRENIFLNGAILGMSRQEIKKKFDEIVAFAETEKFLDTPVKRYSSGMYVRLAFAVAAHLEPEILIIDEVLSVGDAQFQKKCLGKMGDVAKGGRTVLFVSHNMQAISSLCTKAIYLESGQIKEFDRTDSIIPLYLSSAATHARRGFSINSYVNAKASGTWIKGTEAVIEISWEKHRLPPGWECDIACYSIDGTKVFAIQSHNIEGFSSEDPDINSVTFFVENVGFGERDLHVDIGFRKGPSEPYDVVLSNALVLHPDGKSLPAYRRSDVIVVPNVRCITNKK